MEIYKDLREMLELLNSNKVEYLIVGGYALGRHGAPRYTGDMDILVMISKKNVRRLVKSLKEFGGLSQNLKESDFMVEETVIQIGYPPVRIDFLTSISGVSSQEAWNSRVEGLYDDIPVNFIGREQLIMNKKATGRPRDLGDLERLGVNLEEN